MKQIIESKIEQLKKELSALENKKVSIIDITLYRKIYIEILLHHWQIDNLCKMLEEEKFEIKI